MDPKFVILLVLGSLLIIAVYSSSTNFVSAEINCYTSGEKYICIFTNADPPAKAVALCDKDGKNCTVTWLDKVNVVTPEVKNSIKNAQTANLAKANVEDSNSSEMKVNPSTKTISPQSPSTLKDGTTISK